MSQPLPPNLKEIAKLLDLPRPRLVVVVGAGVSIGASGLPHASWLGLLKHGINYLVQTQFQQQRGTQLEASLEASFSPFDLKNALQHAELVEQALNTPDSMAFTDWLTSAFSGFKAKNDGRDTLEALRDIQEAGALILTTNYDGLLSDITNSPPVTWEEHPEFLRVITRQEPGILHIHGHWQRPSSIVLGRSSYERVVADDDFQQLFRTLWLEYSWLYVGCGDGLDDPNLGRLLEWGKHWGESAMPDYFLAREDRAAEIDKRAEKPKNLVSIGYPSYDDLPQLLHSITPSARSWPFVRVDQEFPLFRAPGSNIPFPTRQEYLDGDVPALDADAEVKQRLLTYGWACVLDLASVGKTTLALRLSTAREQREQPVFYFDLKTEILDDAESRPGGALRRLARPGTLLILDNIHHQPNLARQLWQQWKADPRGSRLLLVATKIQPRVTTTPEQDLIFFEKHPTNPAILLALGPDDLGRIAAHIYRRVSGSLMPEPPREALTEWNRDYRAALNAFTCAVMRGLPDLQRENWLLPPSYASEWVREMWLKPLDKPDLQNIVCLAAFGAQELEMLVPDTGLPSPGRTEEMLKLELVVRTDVGRFGQYHRFSLREPGWGRLILAALRPSPDVESILFDAAARHPMIALIMSHRLRTEGFADKRKRLWAALAANQEVLASNLFLSDVPLSYVGSLLKGAQASSHSPLTLLLWQTIERQPDKLAARAWETSLDYVAYFLELAKQQGRETNLLWEAIESRPDKVAARAWETPLGKLGSFFEVAKQQGRDTSPLWKAIEGQPDKVAARAWETPLGELGSLLEVAKQQGRDTNPLWEAIEGQPDKVAARAWETSLNEVAYFLKLAEQQGRDTNPLWEAIEGQPDKVATRAWETSLEHVTHYMEIANTHKRDTKQLWLAITGERGKPDQKFRLDKLVARAWETTLDGVGALLEVAMEQGCDTKPLWQELLSQPAKLAECAWETPLGKVGSFLNAAKRQGQSTESLCQMLANEPDRLSQKGLSAPIDGLIGFSHYAPTTLLEIALRDIRPGHWNAVPPEKGLGGATWLVWNCTRIGRADLASDLIILLLRRANWRDFPAQSGGFGQACWLLANVPPSATELVEPFLRAVCSNRWLTIAYAATTCGQLASALRQVALHQSVERCRRFHHRGLGGRLFKELAQFETAKTDDQSRMFQLLGSAGLCGWAVGLQSLANVKPDKVSDLPATVLPHRPEATRVEDRQLQLWLGLRAFVSIAKLELPIARDIIERTLELWRENLTETNLEPTSTLHKLNQSMIKWLETCLNANPVGLLPSKEPLWTLVGFPLRLDLPERMRP